ncbi:CBS domain-containing protein [Roseicella aerolata]|uniref:CBS domain-containing protein n=1 Tax=Roseicella aerolata TaxID=2883479 RepID=A0A9X1IKX5_9PROT|nr:CBS domain-containing protein [Roseicella aerolata]MCB4824975.1 CBS domain-containing protein [Roseicella aerolata]
MSDTKRQQNGPGSLDEVARRSSAAAASTAQAAGDALRHSGASGGQAVQQGGRIATEAVRRASEAGTETAQRTSDVAAEVAQRGTWQAAEAQQRFVEDAVNQLKEAGQKLAEAVQQSAEDVRVLLPQPNVAAGGLREMQQALTGLIEGTTRTNLHIAQELFRLANPGAIIELQRRFAREYLDTMVEGQAKLLRAARHSAEQALRPIELQLEQRRRGRQQADRTGQSRPAGRVAEVMSREVRTASPEDTVQQATRLMRDEDTGVLPVGENDRLVGMVTDRDIALRLVAEGKDPARTRVREVMTPEVRYVFEDESLHRAVETMAEQQVRRLPVLNRDKRLVGIVSLGDLATGGQTPRLAGRALTGVTREAGLHDQVAAE